MGATPVADEDLINAGIHPAELESGSVMSGTAYRLATATQSSPVTAETGVLTYVGLTIDETGDRNTVAYCVTHYATVGATTTGGGGMCMTTIESALERLHFGLSVEGSYAPTEVHQAVVWGVPSETRVVDFHLDDGTTYPIPVTQGRTAHLVWTDDRTVESVTFKGMTEHHDEVLSELLPNQ